MTVTATVQKLVDGPHNLVVRLTGTLQTGDVEIGVEKIATDLGSISSDAPGPQAQKTVSLQLLRSAFTTNNYTVTLYWEGVTNGAQTNTVLDVYPPNFTGTRDHRAYGGVSNNASGRTGCVWLTADQQADPLLDGFYDVTLWFRKKYS